MKVFVDTAYYVAALLPRDGLHRTAVALAGELADAELVTADAVFHELLAQVSEHGANTRQRAVELVRAAHGDPSVQVVRQSEQLFRRSLELYEQRPDKGYSLTDCLIMVICRDQDINDVLTHDHHFAQEGFRILM